jgi:hypothetical protein
VNVLRCLELVCVSVVLRGGEANTVRDGGVVCAPLLDDPHLIPRRRLGVDQAVPRPAVGSVELTRVCQGCSVRENMSMLIGCVDPMHMRRGGGVVHDVHAIVSA